MHLNETLFFFLFQLQTGAVDSLVQYKSGTFRGVCNENSPALCTIKIIAFIIFMQMNKRNILSSFLDGCVYTYIEAICKFNKQNYLLTNLGVICFLQK